MLSIEAQLCTCRECKTFQPWSLHQLQCWASILNINFVLKIRIYERNKNDRVLYSIVVFGLEISIWSWSNINLSSLSPILEKNSFRIPMRSPRVRLKSATTPSIWWNSAKCVASNDSLRKTRSMEKYLTGVNSFCRPSLWSILALTAVVCVRRMFFWASSSFQSYW